MTGELIGFGDWVYLSRAEAEAEYRADPDTEGATFQEWLDYQHITTDERIA